MRPDALASGGRGGRAEERARFAVDAERQRELADAFFRAVREADVESLQRLLAPDAEWITDAGGQRPAARNPILGPERITRLVAGVRRRWPVKAWLGETRLNGMPALVGRDAAASCSPFRSSAARVACAACTTSAIRTSSRRWRRSTGPARRRAEAARAAAHAPPACYTVWAFRAPSGAPEVRVRRGVEDPLEDLVHKLVQQDVRSEYLDRLKRRVDVEQAHDDLRREIASEMASALGRSEARVNRALLELELIGRELQAAWGEGRVVLVAAFNEARRHALARRRDLEIHREAIGLRRPPGFYDLYPVPPRAR